MNLKGDKVELEIIRGVTRASKITYPKTFMKRNWKSTWKKLFSTFLINIKEHLPLGKFIRQPQQIWPIILKVQNPVITPRLNILDEIAKLSDAEIRTIGKIEIHNPNWTTKINSINITACSDGSVKYLIGTAAWTLWHKDQELMTSQLP